MVNLYSVHMDEEHWGDPHSFRPERFLDSDGAVVHDDWLIPFGLGESLILLLSDDYGMQQPCGLIVKSPET